MTQALRILFIGGTGIISRACVELAVARGHAVTVLNRGRSSRSVPDGATSIVADINEIDAVERLLDGLPYDAVVDFQAFTPADVARGIRLFGGRASQYVFISSASAYQTPPVRFPVTESSPLRNPLWAYSRAKIACEDAVLAAYRETGFPVTIVRPSHTYDETMVPFDGGWTVVARMLEGREAIVPGDGTSLWTITHAREFAVGLIGLLGRPEAIGEAFHITSDHPITWNAIYEAIAAAAGVEPRLLHVASDAIWDADKEWGAALRGDKANSMVFDNSKIRALVPEFVATYPFTLGAREIIAWHLADPTRQRIDPHLDGVMDRLASRFSRITD